MRYRLDPLLLEEPWFWVLEQEADGRWLAEVDMSALLGKRPRRPRHSRAEIGIGAPSGLAAALDELDHPLAAVAKRSSTGT